MQKTLLVLCAVLLGVMIASEIVIKDDEHRYIPEQNVVIDGRDYRTGFPEDCTNYLPEELNIPAPKKHYPDGSLGPGAFLGSLPDDNPAKMLFWGTDVLIDPGALGEQPISADRGGDGDTVFVGIIKHGTGIDSLKVFRSVNRGQTWTMIRAAYGSNQTYSHLTLRYARGTQNWVFVFWVITDASNNGDVWGRRISVDGSSATFFHPTTMSDPDTITWVTATRDFDTNYGLNVFWHDRYPDNTIKRVRSTDYGSTWGDLGNNQSGSTNPHIDYGADGYLYVCTKKIVENDIRVARGTDYGSSGWYFDWVTTDSNEHIEGLPRVAATHDAGPTGKAWVTYNYDNGSDWDSRYGYTTDGGSSWQINNVLAGGSEDQGGTDIECSGYGSNFTRAIFLNNVYGEYKIDYRSNSGTNPTNWDSAITLSDTFVYGGMMPKVTNYGSSIYNSGLVVFPGPTIPEDIWCDAYHNTGVEYNTTNVTTVPNLSLQSNPIKGLTSISYILKKQSSVEILVHKTNGEVVANIKEGTKSAGPHSVRWDVSNLASGVYIVTLKSNGTRTAIRKVVLTK